MPLRVPITEKGSALEMRSLRGELAEYNAHREKAAKNAKEIRYMLYILLLVNLAMFAFVIGVMARYVLG